MNSTRNIKSWGIVSFILIAILVAAAAFFVSLNKRPIFVQQQNGIEVIEQGDQKIVRNIVEGYQVTVPKEWTVPNTILTDEKIIVQYIGPDQKLETEMQEGVYMQVYVDNNPEDLSIQEWAKKFWSISEEKINLIKINNLDILKTTEKVIFGRDEPSPIIIEDSQVTDLSITLNGKIYTYSCTARGKNYLSYSEECEKIAMGNIQELIK
jgi:hypothetical protein